MDGCLDQTDVCQLKIETNQTIVIKFTPQDDFKMLNLTVDAVIGGVKRQAFPVESAGDVCKRLSCPLKQFQEQTLYLNVYISDMPRIHISTMWKFLSSDGTTQGCFTETFQIVR